MTTLCHFWIGSLVILFACLREDFKILVISSDICTHEKNIKLISQDNTRHHILKELNIDVIGTGKSKLVKPYYAVLETLSEHFDLQHNKIQLIFAHFDLIKYTYPVLLDKQFVELLYYHV